LANAFTKGLSDLAKLPSETFLMEVIYRRKKEPDGDQHPFELLSLPGAAVGTVQVPEGYRALYIRAKQSRA
jgi:hypothetical protein